MTAYREKIILTYQVLLKSHEDLVDRIINVGMTGEYAEANEVFKPGDTYKFDLEQFRGTNDINLNMLLAFFDELEEVMNALVNINGITEEELEDNFI